MYRVVGKGSELENWLGIELAYAIVFVESCSWAQSSHLARIGWRINTNFMEEYPCNEFFTVS